ncbi:MAG: amino acid carrier protein, partial [Flavobacteriales bacterium]|nr:amino acid carrier protein [Flavobacteriales bacterium]
MQDVINTIINGINDYLWTYVLVSLLIFCGVYFTIRLRGVQFRHPVEMVSLLGESIKKSEDKKGISSFQAFCVSIASRVGTGNLAGVATAISIGGAASIFWMWVMALIGAASAFVESTLAQVYKQREKGTYIGGPAYYILYGLRCKWAAVLFAVVICITFGLSFNSVQSNTISQAFSKSYDIQGYMIGIFLCIATFVIIFGGIRRIAALSSVIVPVMAILYISITLYILVNNFSLIPSALQSIFSEAFGVRQFTGGVLGAGVMQ